MKKLFAVLLAVALLGALSLTAGAAYTPATVYKATTAPTVDGVVSAGEYDTVLEYSASNNVWEQTTGDVSGYDCTIYLAWDADYLYFAFTAKTPATGRTFSNTDWASAQPYIFDRLSVMTAMTYMDPTADAKFAPADGVAWDWGAASACSWAREWTISMQADGSQLNANHFGAVSTNANFAYKVASAGGVETYEQKIPFAAISDGTNTVNAAIGGKVGFAIAAVIEEVSGENGLSCFFGKGISGGKNFAQYGILEFADVKPADESEPAGDESETPPAETGDAFAIFAIVAILALAGSVVVVKVRK